VADQCSKITANIHYVEYSKLNCMVINNSVVQPHSTLSTSSLVRQFHNFVSAVIGH